MLYLTPAQVDISIHVPREGHDQGPIGETGPQGDFYPRAP